MINPLHQQDFNRLYYQSGSFSEGVEEKLFHGFFGRQGGVSRNVYSSLNCGPGSEDDEVSVNENRRKVAEMIGLPAGYLLSVHQAHGAECVKVDQPWILEERPEGDAMVTDKSGLALGVLSADCAPVLFYGEKEDGTPVIGAAHAGWAGALKGVLDNTIQGMEDLGAQKDTIRACIGPCIGKESYEVKKDFVDPFLKENPDNERFFLSAREPGHWMFDLAGYCTAKLAALGLKKVFIKDLDTYFNEDEFFSCRRALHRNERDYGRQVSTIMIRPG